MRMVLACGLSMPVSMIVVHSSRLARWPVKSRITRSSSRSFIWPWPVTMRASGTSFSSFSRMLAMVSTSLCRKYTWPPRLSSRSTASRMMPSEKRLTKVLIARRFCGAVAITEKSRRPSMRHRQRARDRRRGQRQHVDLGAHRLQRFLLAHAEAVLLVDDHQPEALEFDILADQLVRADDDVDPAVGQFLQRLRRFLRRLEAGDLGDLHRPVGEAVDESLEMLFAKQRRRAQHGHLLAAGHRAEGGAQGDFGLAEADVAADQPVHRLARAHVVDHRGDGRGLIAGFLETETVGERFVVVLVEARRRGPRGRRGRRKASAARRRCRAPARRPCAWPFPTGRNRACAAARPPDRRRNSARSRATAPPARTAWPRWRNAVRGIPARPGQDPCAPARGSGRCRGFHAPPGHRP